VEPEVARHLEDVWNRMAMQKLTWRVGQEMESVKWIGTWPSLYALLSVIDVFV
jgi:hypothetical protein